MAKAKRHAMVSLLQAAIPGERGPAKHYERTDDFACTEFNREGQVQKIHTPQDALRRVHEVMHARHTKVDDYPGIRSDVMDVIEDCRLHMKHWPWRYNETPNVVAESTIGFIQNEVAAATRAKKEHPGDCVYSDFATRLRGNAVYDGLGYGVCGIPFSTKVQNDLAQQVYRLINNGCHLEAAKTIEKVFFVDEVDGVDDDEGDSWKSEEEEAAEEYVESLRKTPEYKKLEKKTVAELEKEAEKKRGGPRSRRYAKMDIIYLEHIEQISHAASVGYRLATSGSRIYRPALRRPVLPQRIFWKHSPTAPSGVIVFDASSSMGVSEKVLLDCCLRAPTATVAYYSGDDGTGVGSLWVFAKDGYRAIRVTSFPGGNAVDGPAMDWMLEQDGPRIMVTDRGFCGADDSFIQLARLDKLEQMDEIKVYTSYSAFQGAYPLPETAMELA